MLVNRNGHVLFLLFFSGFKLLEVRENYEIGQLCMEGPTDEYVRFIRKLDRKHCRLSHVHTASDLVHHPCSIYCTRWGEQKIFMQGMWYGTRNVGSDFMRMPGSGNDKDKDLRLGPHGSESN